MARKAKPKLSSAGKKLLAQSEAGVYSLSLLSGTPPEVLDEVFLFETYPARHRLLTDLANLRDTQAAGRFWRTWASKFTPEFPQGLFELSEELRVIWREPDSPNSQQALDKWLRWTPSPAHLQVERYLMGSDEREKEPRYHMPFWCSTKAGKLVPNFLSLRAMLIQGVLEHWQHFQFCTNPRCAAPHFIAKRRDQTVCDAGDCKAMKQREHALKWWRENRAKKTQAKAEKRRLKGGSHKTR